jgi:hypothetical protein
VHVHCETDSLVMGVISGILSTVAAIMIATYLLDISSIGSSASSLDLIVVSVVVVAFLLLIKPLMQLTICRDSVDPFLGPSVLRASLTGRVVGILLGIPFAISMVAGGV